MSLTDSDQPIIDESACFCIDHLRSDAMCPCEIAEQWGYDWDRLRRMNEHVDTIARIREEVFEKARKACKGGDSK